jgi:hypothetical protein
MVVKPLEGRTGNRAIHRAYYELPGLIVHVAIALSACFGIAAFFNALPITIVLIKFGGFNAACSPPYIFFLASLYCLWQNIASLKSYQRLERHDQQSIPHGAVAKDTSTWPPSPTDHSPDQSSLSLREVQKNDSINRNRLMRSELAAVMLFAAAPIYVFLPVDHYGPTPLNFIAAIALVTCGIVKRKCAAAVWQYFS